MDVCTTAEAAKFLEVSTTRVRQYLHEGRLVHGGYRRATGGRVMALVEMESLKRLRERREQIPSVATARARKARW